MTTAETPEFSRPIAAEGLPDRESRHKLEATDAERAALARRFDVNGVDEVKAMVRLTPAAKGIVRMEGDFDVRLSQLCCVTLKPLEAHLTATFSREYSHYALEEQEENKGAVLDFDGDMPDPVEPIIDGRIDMGEAVVEEIALRINPFPRADGAVFDGVSGDEEGESGDVAAANPFAALAGLKNKLEQSD